jgi:hypothetical protein
MAAVSVPLVCKLVAGTAADDDKEDKGWSWSDTQAKNPMKTNKTETLLLHYTFK